jgi:adenylosuccinate synthase
VAAHWVLDFGFGDAGKGSVVDALVRRVNASLVVRYNGGAQAAHHVVLPDGTTHCFSQFGAGTFAGADTFLSRFMLIDPLALRNEGAALHTKLGRDPFDQLFVSVTAPLITPYHRLLNQIREIARGDAKHGSCGMGIGETMEDIALRPDLVVRVGDCGNLRHLVMKLADVRDDKRRRIEALSQPVPSSFLDDQHMDRIAQSFRSVIMRAHIVDSDWLRVTGDVVFEGAQGLLIDQDYGFHPHTTWSDCTFKNAKTLTVDAGCDRIYRIGVCRAYSTRHGAGPFPSFDPTLTTAIPDAHNGRHPWQGDFRVGWFDLVLAEYARRVVGGFDSIAITNLDRLRAYTRAPLAAVQYESPRPSECQSLLDAPRKLNARLTELLFASTPVFDTFSEESLIAQIESTMRAPVTLRSQGPTHVDKAWYLWPVHATA